MPWDFLNQAWETISDSTGMTPADLLGLLVKGLLGLVSVVTPFVIYFLVSLPLRRRERAHLFLDLVEEGLRRGQGVEATLRELSHTRDRSLGRRFLRLAAELDQGVPLDEALAAAPNLLPPQVESILCSGHAAGDVRRVLPACRLVL
ncbi:MAG TPA: type II secretion system F family protein, partial [Myxococcota bacterium]|nr:type II secretion system F family protein [Myxococcota bacterium]